MEHTSINYPAIIKNKGTLVKRVGKFQLPKWQIWTTLKFLGNPRASFITEFLNLFWGRSQILMCPDSQASVKLGSSTGYAPKLSTTPIMAKGRRQKYSRLKWFLCVKGWVICCYQGWFGSILQFRHNILKVGSKPWLLTCSSSIALSLPSYTGSALKRELHFCNGSLGLLCFWAPAMFSSNYHLIP